MRVEDHQTKQVEQHEKNGNDNTKLIALIGGLVGGMALGVCLLIIACIVYRRKKKYNHIGTVDDLEGFEMNGDRRTMSQKQIDGQVAFETIELMDRENSVSLPEPTLN